MPREPLRPGASATAAAAAGAGKSESRPLNDFDDGNGGDHALGIDNFSFSAAVPEPSLPGLAAALLALAHRRRR